jgi:hypothetical protein
LVADNRIWGWSCPVDQSIKERTLLAIFVFVAVYILLHECGPGDNELWEHLNRGISDKSMTAPKLTTYGDLRPN